MRRPLTVLGAILMICTAGCTGSENEGGLTADSTCAEFNAASIPEQRLLIAEMVREASGGQSNPLREGNAVMQITYVCQEPGQESQRVGDIAI
jgi:hypothetical protein